MSVHPDHSAFEEALSASPDLGVPVFEQLGLDENTGSFVGAHMFDVNHIGQLGRENKSGHSGVAGADNVEERRRLDLAQKEFHTKTGYISHIARDAISINERTQLLVDEVRFGNYGDWTFEGTLDDLRTQDGGKYTGLVMTNESQLTEEELQYMDDYELAQEEAILGLYGPEGVLNQFEDELNEAIRAQAMAEAGEEGYIRRMDEIGADVKAVLVEVDPNAIDLETADIDPTARAMLYQIREDFGGELPRYIPSTPVTSYTEMQQREAAANDPNALAPAFTDATAGYVMQPGDPDLISPLAQNDVIAQQEMLLH